MASYITMHDDDELVGVVATDGTKIATWGHSDAMQEGLTERILDMPAGLTGRADLVLDWMATPLVYLQVSAPVEVNDSVQGIIETFLVIIE